LGQHAEAKTVKIPIVMMNKNHETFSYLVAMMIKRFAQQQQHVLPTTAAMSRQPFILQTTHIY